MSNSNISNINSEQAVEWIETIARNVEEFRRKPRLNKKDKLEFIHNQYSSLYLLHRAIQGSVKFTGAKQIFR